ncbi:MAG: ABC transporter ATP-binding protein [Rubrobacter sp.]|nr:ABC transporter ATP-binding protein [Rubrobacter sp.]
MDRDSSTHASLEDRLTEGPRDFRPGEAPSVIQTRGLARTYGRVRALSPLDLDVPEGSIFGFLGPNGAGKTTTIKLLLGLTRPSSGSAEIFGHDVVSESLAVRRRVGYLAQEPHFYGYMTARQTLRFTAKFFYSGPEKAIEERVAESLELVGLEDKADRRLRGFSGGERQRLGLAQAQVNDPDLLILDEPAASLDPMGRRDVLEIMKGLRAERGTTIFYSTHILEDVQRISDAAAILKGGELAAQAPIGELMAEGGAGSAVYELLIKGPDEALRRARADLEGREWLVSIEESAAPAEDFARRWKIYVTDAAAAEGELLRAALTHESVSIESFGRKRQSLEEAFLDLVEGEHEHR